SNDAGNCVITAHSGLLKASFFTNLDRLTIGDTFTIRMFGASYVYTVDLIDITVPDDTEFMNVPDGKSHATLYTCTPVGENTHRLIVRGTLMDNAGNETDTAIGADDNTTGRLIVGMSTLAFIIVPGIWMAAIIVRAKKDRQARCHKR
ncbi:MAG: sortase, partial [Candidatus Flemingibacterium sp.]|nr:sortase [Candidatus Flemingibacterium sp.]